MAKLKKSQLKGLVKECLVEILSEGIQVDAESKGYSQKRRNIDPESNYPPRSSALDSIQFGQQTKRNEMFEKNTENAVRNMTEDPILSSILKDKQRWVDPDREEYHQVNMKTTLHQQPLLIAQRNYLENLHQNGHILLSQKRSHRTSYFF